MCVHAKGPHELQDVNRFPVTAIIDVDHLVFLLKHILPVILCHHPIYQVGLGVHQGILTNGNRLRSKLRS